MESSQCGRPGALPVRSGQQPGRIGLARCRCTCTGTPRSRVLRGVVTPVEVVQRSVKHPRLAALPPHGDRRHAGGRSHLVLGRSTGTERERPEDLLATYLAGHRTAFETRCWSWRGASTTTGRPAPARVARRKTSSSRKQRRARSNRFAWVDRKLEPSGLPARRCASPGRSDASGCRLLRRRGHTGSYCSRAPRDGQCLTTRPDDNRKAARCHRVQKKRPTTWDRTQARLLVEPPLSANLGRRCDYFFTPTQRCGRALDLEQAIERMRHVHADRRNEA